MAVSDIEAVLEFLRKNGLSDSESALMEDILDKSDFRSFDFEKFLFMTVPPPPPLKIPATRLQLEPSGGVDAADSASDSSDEFVSLASSTTDDVCSSEFTNPYGIRITKVNSQASSERLSEFGTARDYPDFDMQNDLHWYNERDEDYAMPSHFGEFDSFGCPSEDKFVMALGKEKQGDCELVLDHISERLQVVERSTYLDKPWPFNNFSVDNVNKAHVMDCYNLEENVKRSGNIEKEDKHANDYSCSGPMCICFGGAGGFSVEDSPGYNSLTDMKVANITNFQYRDVDGNPIACDCALEQRVNKSCNYSIDVTHASDWDEECKKFSADFDIGVAEKNFQPNENDCYEVGNSKEIDGAPQKPDPVADEDNGITADELLIYDDTRDDEYEVFNLRIIHRKNRTGFEENKDLPIVLNSIIAGRYYVTEYLGSAAFSRVVQAHDLQTGIDVCLKIIKNDKDFFDQSLDEIKLLKFVNKNDPGDERHILRLYDYFYHQEHLFIVCELLRANLYEFQKYNGESGGEPYFTLSRLQVITRQCLEALEYLHYLGIIHCDLKPENILIKSYRRCEIKVIDLGSSCFQTDNLCLYVQSRSYRAPEIILGLPYDQKIDLWSLGCILAELCSGEVLFPNEALVLLLARMIGMLGPIDAEMLASGQETHKYFTKEYDLYHTNEETDQVEYIIPEESSLENHLQVSDIGFIDFLRDLLEINPQRRPTAREALEHPWLSHQYSVNSC